MRYLITFLICVTILFSANILKKNLYRIDYTQKTTGLVRHMKLYKYPKWASKIELANGKKIFFSSPKSMFEFYFRPGKWYDMGVKSEADFKVLLVTDYQTLRAIDAKKAYFVYGSRAISPAGDDLVAFKSEAIATKFAKKNNGKRVLTFNQINDALIRLLNGRI